MPATGAAPLGGSRTCKGWAMAPQPPTTAATPPAPPPRSTRGNTFASLKQRDFRLLWIGTVSAGFGQWGQQIGMNWLVYVITGSALQLGAVSFASGILALILGPFAGLLADRYSRRAIIIISNALGGGQAAVVAVLVITDTIVLWHVYAFALLSSLTMVVNQPARQAYVNDVSTKETLGNAIAMNSIAMNASRLVGPPLTGVIVAWNVGAAFVFVAATRLLAAVAAAAMRRRKQEALPRRNPFREVIDGFSYLGRDRLLLLLLIANGLPSLLVYPYINFMPIYAEEIFGRGAEAYGLLVSMLAVGSIIGLIGLAYLGDVRRKGPVFLAAFLIYLCLVLTFSRIDMFYLALGILATAGFFHGLATTLNNTVFQSALRPDMRGRGMAAFQMGAGLMPLGALSMGFAVEHLGVQNGAALCQFICLCGIAAIAVFGKSVHRA